MFRNIVFSAVGAGLVICVAISVLQFFTTEPLILHAEEFEVAAGQAPLDHGTADEAAIQMSTAPDEGAAMNTPAPEAVHTHDEEEWGPSDGLERAFFTVLANLVVGVAVSLMLLGLMVLKGEPIDARRGLLWGAAAFVAVSLLPSLGLPPELPGTPAAEIVSRQTWWVATAFASAAGIGLIVFGRERWWWPAFGAVLIVAPHVIGAPVPPSHDVAYPGALAGEFVIASLVVSAAMWALAGAGSGWLYRRLTAAA